MSAFQFLLLITLGLLTFSTQAQTWTGAVDSDWNKSGNWDQGVPTTSDNVYIPNVANAPIISGTTTAETNSVTIETDGSLTILTGGILNINGAASGSSASYSGTYGILNLGLINNDGTITIGATASSGSYGIFNREAIFNNNTNGTVHIDQALYDGIWNIDATLNNYGSIKIGQNSSINGEGIDCDDVSNVNNYANAEIVIDNVTAAGLAFGFYANFYNEGTIDINQSGTPTESSTDGIESFNPIVNKTTGIINIDFVNTHGIQLFNPNSDLINEGEINIGQNSPTDGIGNNGIQIYGLLDNKEGAILNVDQTASYAIFALYDSGVANRGTINVGQTGSVGSFGIFAENDIDNWGTINIDNTENTAFFSNVGELDNWGTISIGKLGDTYAGAAISFGFSSIINNYECALIDIASDNTIVSNNATITNNGVIIENGSGNSNIEVNNGIVQNLNGGTFTITTDNGNNTETEGVIWTGCTDTDWNTASNWHTGSVPTASDNVYIPNVTNDPIIDGTTSAETNSVTIETDGSLTISTNGALNITGAAPGNTLSANQTYGLLNQGNLSNDGTITMGTITNTAGKFGIINYVASFENNANGIIQIDHFSFDGIWNRQETALNNYGIIQIKQDGVNVGNGTGINSSLNGSINNYIGAEIRIYNIASTGLYIGALDDLYNEGQININQNGQPDQYCSVGISSFNPLVNTETGVINIDYTNNEGIDLKPSGLNSDLDNSGIINIGQNGPAGSIGGNGIEVGGEMNNATGAVINLDNATSVGLLCEGTTSNYGTLNIGQTSTMGSKGVQNEGIFNNYGLLNVDNTAGRPFLSNGDAYNEGEINIGLLGNSVGGAALRMNDGTSLENAVCAIINIASNNTIVSNNATIINNGLIIENGSGNSNIDVNNGIVQNLNGGTFNITTNNEIVIAPSLGTCDEISPAFELGTVIDFNILGVFTDKNATQSAGTYDISTNIFTSSVGFIQSDLYVQIEDPINGCTRIVSWPVTIGDDTPPTAFCSDIIISLDASSNASISTTDIDNGSFDACGIASIALNQYNFDCTDVGLNTITMTVTDNSGNTSSCNATVTVKDEIAPEAVCLHPTITFNGEDQLTIPVADIFDAANSTDNCGNVNLVSPQNDQIIDCANLGDLIDVTITVEDDAGNQNTCIASILVEGLPCDWQNDGGIGCNSPANDYGYDFSTDEFSLTADACTPTFPYIEDQIAFTYTELCGDGEIIARVTSLQGSGIAGIMMRNSLDAGSPMIALGTNNVDRIQRQVRVLANYPAYPQMILSYDKFWLKISRTGNLFKAYASADGVTWMPYLNQQINMSNNCLVVGMYTYSSEANEPTVATFDNVSINYFSSAIAGLPSSTTVGESLSQLLDINVFPNPAIDILNVDVTDFYGQSIQITLFNSVGQQVIQNTMQEVQESINEINVSHLEAGVYHLMVSDGKQQITKRVVVAKK